MSKDLRNRLYDYEVPPPPAAWDKIASALDDSHLSDQFPSTLYNLEATPPATAWSKINEALSPILEERPVRRLNPIWKYAAAAAFIGALAFGGIRLFNNSTPDETVATRSNTPSLSQPSETINSTTEVITQAEPTDPKE